MTTPNKPKEDKYKEITSIKFNISSPEEIKRKYPQFSVYDKLNKIIENVSRLDPLRKQETETIMRKFIEKKRCEFEEKRRIYIFEKIHKLDVLHKKKPIISDYTSMSGIAYTKYFVDLFNINEEKAVEILKKYKGNIYNAIILYNHLLYPKEGIIIENL